MGKRREADFFELQAWNISGWEDDFQGDLFSSGAAPGMYQSTASGTASATAAVSTGVVNGAALLDAGTDNSGRSDLSWGLHYQGQLNAIYVARFKVPVITTRKFEIGFTDVISGTDAGAVNVKATPSFTATDCAVLVLDTNDDTNLTLVGAKAGVAASVADFSTALVADTYYYFGVSLFDDNARGFILNADGVFLEEKIIEDCVTETVLLTPWVFVQNRAANAGSMTLDWHKAYQRRTTTV
jgi:hypothetical protein